MKSLPTMALLGALLVSGAASAATLQVKIDGVASNKGKLRVAVCDQSSFLKKCAIGAMAPARTGSVTVEVPDVPAGDWAVMAYHDENDNQKMDRNEMGIPSEGYGFSHNASAKFGPPQFKQATVTVGASAVTVPVTLKY
ncbi:hypothetical protein ASF61_13115 [Duganella sp. Leaf126]|uniref:DUF2141 domain-containing protein n=1 Tax=Duganella sp. Leaf126 TaxID=1736266 RepID=UPI0007021B43|nr:DUF2141 domain-containing protein [Duganella sp. Leaf126]KQQ33018.1 hypothetical protein ASF61_13115 [Duganella sp. Leaf126]